MTEPKVASVDTLPVKHNDDEAEEAPLRFSPEQEAKLLDESNTQKIEANTSFKKAEYTVAIDQYDKALISCPNYLEYEIAVLKSNISACHLMLKEWKLAVDTATTAIDHLNNLEPKKKDGEGKELDKGDSGRVEEVEDDDEEELNEGGPAPKRRYLPEDIRRIRAKALMRRAKARSEIGGWAVLESAMEDYKILSKYASLPEADRRIVQRQLNALPPRLEEAKTKEMGEMMGKLKQLGNGILKPFGLSTDNFNMVKDETTGGYSMAFNQGGDKQ